MLMLNSHLTLNESHFVSKFIYGLDDALRLNVQICCPTIVEQAAEKVRL